MMNPELMLQLAQDRQNELIRNAERWKARHRDAGLDTVLRAAGPSRHLQPSAERSRRWPAGEVHSRRSGCETRPLTNDAR